MDIERPSILDVSEPLSHAMNEISRTGLPVLVTKNGKYYGIIDERSIRQRVARPKQEKCGAIAERTPTLAPESTVMDACNAFFAGRFKAIPVIGNGKVQGAITRHTLLQELLTERMLSRKRVQEVMTSPVASLDISSTIGQARSELRKHNIRRLVVTDGGKIAGLLSVFDLAGYVSSPRQRDAFYRGGEKTSMDVQPVASYVKKNVETISESDSLASAVKKMLEKRVAALIVEEGRLPVGIVTAKDILHAALASEKKEQVFISGLPYELREMHGEIAKEGGKLLEKLGKSFSASSLAFHIKPDGSGFAVRARLDGNKSFNASAFDYRLERALHKVNDELRKMAEKTKAEGRQKKSRESSLRED